MSVDDKTAMLIEKNCELFQREIKITPEQMDAMKRLEVELEEKAAANKKESPFPEIVSPWKDLIRLPRVR